MKKSTTETTDVSEKTKDQETKLKDYLEKLEETNRWLDKKLREWERTPLKRYGVFYE